MESGDLVVIARAEEPLFVLTEHGAGRSATGWPTARSPDWGSRHAWVTSRRRHHRLPREKLSREVLRRVRLPARPDLSTVWRDPARVSQVLRNSPTGEVASPSHDRASGSPAVPGNAALNESVAVDRTAAEGPGSSRRRL
jgi:hypothetical protein